MIDKSLERLALRVHDGALSRRRFMRHAAHAGLALPAASSLLMATGGRSWAQPNTDLTGDITMIKGPHSANEAEFEAMIIEDFNRDVAPNVNVNFTTYDWANMNTELTTGFASGLPARRALPRRPDLSGLCPAGRAARHDRHGQRPGLGGGEGRHRALRLGPGGAAGRHLGRAGAGRGLQYLPEPRPARRRRRHRQLGRLLRRHAGSCAEDDHGRGVRLLHAQPRRRLRLLGLVPLHAQCRRQHLQRGLERLRAGQRGRQGGDAVPGRHPRRRRDAGGGQRRLAGHVGHVQGRPHRHPPRARPR